MTAAPVRPAQAISDKVPSGIALVRRATDPSCRPQSSIENLQTAGNRFAAQFLQAKLKVGQAGDHYEQEADRVAERHADGGLRRGQPRPVDTPLPQRLPRGIRNDDDAGLPKVAG